MKNSYKFTGTTNTKILRFQLNGNEYSMDMEKRIMIDVNGRRMLETKIKCDCECHEPGKVIMHFMDCCNGGWKYFYDEVDENDNILPKKPILEGFQIIIPKEYNKLIQSKYPYIITKQD